MFAAAQVGEGGRTIAASATRISAPASRRAATRVGSASGEVTTITGDWSRVREELGVEGQAGLGVEDDADRLARDRPGRGR